MSILYAHSLKCSLNFKAYSQLFLGGRHLSLLQPRLKTGFLNEHHYITLRRYSWSGFYYAVSTSTPVITVQNILVDFHNFSGLPWWTVIVLATLGIRSVIVLPLAVHQNQVIARLANLNAELGKMAPEMTKEVNIASKIYGWDASWARRVYRKNMREYYQKFILRDNCHPFKIALLALFQVPIWMFFSVSLRNLTLNPSIKNLDTELLQQQFKSEGTLWFPDLTLPDIYFIPVLLAAVNLLLIEIHALRQIEPSTKIQKTLIYATRVISIVVAGAATLNPSSVTFYWLCSSTFGLFQSIMLMSPKCRRILRIPSTSKDSQTPYKDIAANFRKRFLS